MTAPSPRQPGTAGQSDREERPADAGVATTPTTSSSPDVPSADSTAHARRAIVALTGGIACYKSATLVSRLVQRRIDTRVLMTDAAARFITPLTMESLSGHRVVQSIWQEADDPSSPHIELARWADAMIIAPASANILAKLASGLCDDIVCLVAAALPKSTPVLLAPAMNAQMWEHAITQRNVATLDGLPGWSRIGPEHGWQACRTEGAGRMAEPDAIASAALELLRPGG